MLTATSGTAIVTGAVTDIGTSLAAVITAAVALMVAVFVVRKGIRWAKGAAR